MLMLNRAFFSLQSNWVPTAIALGNLFLNVILDVVLYRVGAWGIALSTAICNVAGTAALLVLLRSRLGRFEGARIAATVVKVVARVGGRRRGRVVRLASARLGARPLVPRAGRLARPRARRVGRRLSRGLPGARRCGRWTCCCRCARASAAREHPVRAAHPRRSAAVCRVAAEAACRRRWWRDRRRSSRSSATTCRRIEGQEPERQLRDRRRRAARSG